MANYSIKDLEKLSGIKAHTLRIWEKRYKLLEPKRTATNIRFYDDEDLKRILNVSLLNHNGVKISRIAELDQTELAGMISDLSKQSPDIRNMIEKLVMSMVELDERKFEKTIAKSVQLQGFEDTVLHLIYPFFEKIGVLWQTGIVNPAQEHFVSNLIRSKLIAAIDKQSVSDLPVSQRIVMFLPEGEMHEITLLFYYFLAKKRGYNVFYLGQSVPLKDLISVVREKPCDIILTVFSTTFSGIDINSYITTLSETFSSSKILFTSFNYENMIPQFPNNVERVKNAQHLVEILDSKDLTQS